MAFFPFMIDISNKHCLVVGGGSIALHKIKILAEFGVYISVVAPVISEAVQEMKEKNTSLIKLINREFKDSDIDGMDFVVAATDDGQLNKYISEMCKKRNILINCVDMPELCSFIFPAIIKDEDMLIAVSSGGKSPATASYIKKKIQENIPEYYGEMIESIGKYRTDILERVSDTHIKKQIFNKMLQYGDEHNGEIPKEYVEKLLESYNN